MNPDLQQIERLLFQRYGNTVDIDKLPAVFIVAAPRTGSTLLYQYLINRYNVWYVTNLVNDQFPTMPALGVALEQSLGAGRDAVAYESSYGKTEGVFAPSEGSHIFRNWFGGKHPAQTCSSRTLPGMNEHLTLTLKCIHGLTGRALLTKNAWNCFRIQELSRLLPNSHFLWMRRDIRTSAVSDLEARYRRGGTQVWNSATTANYEEIQKRPYWEQVVEQQYEYNVAVGKDLHSFRPERHIEVWYEDLCANPDAVSSELDTYFTDAKLGIVARPNVIPRFAMSPGPKGLCEDRERIVGYVAAEHHRLSEYIYSHHSLISGSER